MVLDEGLAGMILRESSNPTTQVEAGGNSSVARVAIGGHDYAVKDYSQRSDAFLRQQREWHALTLLSDLSPGIAPTPLWCFEDRPILIYSWVNGWKPKWNSETVRAMVRILRDLRNTYDHLPENHSVPLAIDSVTDIADLNDQVSKRLVALGAKTNPRLQRILVRIASQLENLWPKMTSGGEKHQPQLTLSPSDFGPHNIIYDAGDSKYRLIDLEFFGIDDVHKLIGDTILHPQISWTRPLLQEFLEEATEIFDFSWERLDDFLPFLSLKWAVIVAGRIARLGGSSVKNGWDEELADLASFYSDLAQSGQADEAISRILENASLKRMPNPSDGEV